MKLKFKIKLSPKIKYLNKIFSMEHPNGIIREFKVLSYDNGRYTRSEMNDFSTTYLGNTYTEYMMEKIEKHDEWNIRDK